MSKEKDYEWVEHGHTIIYSEADPDIVEAIVEEIEYFTERTKREIDENLFNADLRLQV